jgi:hypothetical protein
MFAFLRLLLVFWLVACLAGIFAARRFRRRMHPGWHPGRLGGWRHYSHW